MQNDILVSTQFLGIPRQQCDPILNQGPCLVSYCNHNQLAVDIHLKPVPKMRETIGKFILFGQPFVK